tara:strand:- start:655 stop:1371 length:717 start_codon:yes stop_codon:yes gene_type:complete
MDKLVFYIKNYNVLTLIKFLYFETIILIKGLLLNSYSQHGEDLFIYKYFKKKNSGFYIDIGAYHPKRFSNTFFFYNKSWKGINIEANPDLIHQFNNSRVRDLNLNLGVSNVKEKLSFYVFNPPTLSTFDFNSKEEYIAKGYDYVKSIMVEVLPIREIINQYCKNTIIDFISIDVEGHEIEVLEGFNNLNNLPKLICLESLDLKFEKKETFDEILDTLKNLGYIKIKEIGVNVFFEKTN